MPQKRQEPPADREEVKASEVPPTKDPSKAAGSLNPKEKGAFYETVAQRPRGRRRR